MKRTKYPGHSPKSYLMLEKALELVNSVPYKVSLRWVFYGLYQLGYFPRRGKDAYNSFIKKTSQARKERAFGWHPTTLVDDTREILYLAYGEPDINTCIQSLPELSRYVDISINHFYYQPNYIELAFEAHGMVNQFNYYTKAINLIPFGGDASIPHKWNIAKNLERQFERFNKPITILYFGDLDKKGQQIPESAFADIWEWCEVPFDVVLCGLTEEQVINYNVPENPEKPDEYQWVGLSDQAAKEIILSNVSQYIDLEIIDRLHEQCEEPEMEWQGRVRQALEELVIHHSESEHDV